MKNKFLLLGILLIIITSSIFLFYQYKSNQNTIFYLDEKYYQEGKFIDTNSNNLEELINNRKSFLLYVYNNYCSLPIPCENIFEEVMKKYQIDVLKIPFKDFKETDLYQKVKLAPTIIIVENGTIIEYLKADKDKDLKKYQDKIAFEEWLKKYVFL